MNINIEVFTEKEKEYIKSQRLTRISTSSAVFSDGTSQPDVAPVGFDFDDEYLYIGGMNILNSTKYKNILKNNKVALVIDDLKKVNPWDPRGIRIYGIADTIDRQGGLYVRYRSSSIPLYTDKTNKEMELEN